MTKRFGWETLCERGSEGRLPCVDLSGIRHRQADNAEHGRHMVKSKLEG